MSLLITWGDYNRQGRLVYEKAVTDTTPVVAGPLDFAKYRGLALQLITEDQVDPRITTGSAALVASSKTFTISAYDFTGLTGATIRISGAANPGNNGDHIVTTVTSAHVVICNGDASDVNETFNLATATIQVIRTDDPLTGSWLFEVSNTYTKGGLNDPADPGKWTVLPNSAFSPAIADVTDASSQPVQCDPFDFRAYRVTFTPTDGVGTVSVLGFAKSTA